MEADAAVVVAVAEVDATEGVVAAAVATVVVGLIAAMEVAEVVVVVEVEIVGKEVHPLPLPF